MAEAEDSDDDIPLFPRLPDPDDEPLFPGPPLNPAPPGPPPVVMMVPLTIVSDASILAPPPVAPPPFYFPAPFPAVVDEMVEESEDEENVYAHIDARAIDVTLDMPSASPNSMNVTSHRQDKYANLSC